MMVMEVAARGDLKNFLRDCRPTASTQAMLSPAHLLRLAIDVAKGMEFLSERSFVHRDLACRYQRLID
jgi:serine/threonine protein kinase